MQNTPLMDRKQTPCPPSWLKHLFGVLVALGLFLLFRPLLASLLGKLAYYIYGLGLVGQIAFGELVMLATLYLLYWEVRHWRIFVPGRYYLWLGLLGALYGYCRCGGTGGLFWMIPGLGGVAWLDFFALPALVAIVPGCVRRRIADWGEKRKYQEEGGRHQESQGVEPDRAIQDESEDWLGFSGMVGILFEDLEASDLSEESLALGVIAAWGKGKSSFINLLVRKASQNGAICVHFNPRGSKSVEHIQEDFFDTFARELSRHYFGFGFLLGRYTKHLGLLGQYEWTRPLESLLTLLLPQRQMEAINRAIRAMGRRIYVVIDDLDRLTGEEILEVLKLIDRNASFSNTVFVTAYDKAYINNVLRGHLDHGLNHCFIDKYVTCEVTLPEPDKAVLERKMRGFLEARIEDGLFMKTERVLQGWDRVADMVIDQLDSPRHIKRYLNLMIPRYRRIVDEVLPEDYFLVSLLRYTDLDTYNALSGRGILKREDVEAVFQALKEDTGKRETVVVLKRLFFGDQANAQEAGERVDSAYEDTLRISWGKNCLYYFGVDLDASSRMPTIALKSSEGQELRRKLEVALYQSRHLGGQDMNLMSLFDKQAALEGVEDIGKTGRPVEEYKAALKGGIYALMRKYSVELAFSLKSLRLRSKDIVSVFTEEELEGLYVDALRVIAAQAYQRSHFRVMLDLVADTYLYYQSASYSRIVSLLIWLIRAYCNEFGRVILCGYSESSSVRQEYFALLSQILRDGGENISEWIESIPDSQLRYILRYINRCGSFYEASLRLPLPLVEYSEDVLESIYQAIRTQERQ